MSPIPVPEGYRDLREGMAWAEVGPRAAVVVAGADAVRFVDGFCTAAVGRLTPGAGAEAFFLDPRGQVLQWGTVLGGADGVWIDADRVAVGADGAGWSLAAHLERYHIRERLRVVDRAPELAWFIVAGPRAATWMADAGAVVPAGGEIVHDVERMEAFADGVFPGRCAGVPAALVVDGRSGPGSHLIVVPAAERGRIVDRLRADGIPEASPAALDAVRREEGRPSTVDVPPRTLAQELGRDRAICFDKGCYLGQETVARLDALGHVNRRLVGVLCGGSAPPPPGVPVEVAGEKDPVGTITSSGAAPRHDGWLGLALVRVSALRPGCLWSVAGEAARPVLLADGEEGR